ncbi:MAG: hypothetical protein AB1941_27165 [Gemmatimonadota bacterium]
MTRQENAGLSPQQVHALLATLYSRGEISQAQRDRVSRLADEPYFARELERAHREPDARERSDALERILGPREPFSVNAGPAKPSRSLLEHFVDAARHVEQWAPFVLLFLWALASQVPFPAFQDPTFQAGLLLTLGGSVVYLVLASFKQVSGQVSTLTASMEGRITTFQKQVFDDRHDLLRRLSGIESRLGEAEQETIRDFNDALPRMKAEVIRRLRSRQTVKIRILGISAQFSWRNLIDDCMDEYLEALAPGETIDIRVLVVSPGVLDRWRQDRLKISRETFDKDLARFRSDRRRREDYGQFTLTVREFDNLPQWHGIMIDGDVLFLGTTSWQFDRGVPELKVGQNEYRRFTLQDRFGGSHRIKHFDDWFSMYSQEGREVQAGRGAPSK